LYDLIEVSALHPVCIRDYEPNGTERLFPKSDTKVHRLGSIHSVQQFDLKQRISFMGTPSVSGLLLSQRYCLDHKEYAWPAMMLIYFSLHTH
jgi:hypothetical protein